MPLPTPRSREPQHPSPEGWFSPSDTSLLSDAGDQIHGVTNEPYYWDTSPVFTFLGGPCCVCQASWGLINLLPQTLRWVLPHLVKTLPWDHLSPAVVVWRTEAGWYMHCKEIRSAKGHKKGWSLEKSSGVLGEHMNNKLFPAEKGLGNSWELGGKGKSKLLGWWGRSLNYFLKRELGKLMIMVTFGRQGRTADTRDKDNNWKQGY